mmetsp:Transcript_18918/g.72899  ORF Transcript_18918/g.72899 Transcript_18918/m.72899 type:complete len:448 (+) Transcript_18918:53-1396(+)
MAHREGTDQISSGDHGHSHGKDDDSHGHAHGDDHGHGHGADDHGHAHGADHGDEHHHSHGDDHSHGDGKESHGHSHGEIAHGHSHGEEDHGHAHDGGHGHSHGVAELDLSVTRKPLSTYYLPPPEAIPEAVADLSVLVAQQQSCIEHLQRQMKVLNWKTSGFRQFRLAKGHSAGITGCILSEEGKELITCSIDTTIVIWDLASNSARLRLRGHKAAVSCVTTYKGLLLSGSADKTIRIWVVKTGEMVDALAGGHKKTVKVVHQVEDSNFFSGSSDRTICVWNAETLEVDHVLEGHTGGISGLQARGDILLSSSYDGSIREWKWKEGECTRQFLGHRGFVSGLLWQNDLLLTCSFDKTIKRWDYETGSQVDTFKQFHEDILYNIQVDDELILVSTGKDLGIRVWNVRSGECIRVLKCSTECNWLQVRGNTVIGGTANGDVIGWSMFFF